MAFSVRVIDLPMGVSGRGRFSRTLPVAETVREKRVLWSADDAAIPSARNTPGTTNGR